MLDNAQVPDGWDDAVAGRVGACSPRRGVVYAFHPRSDGRMRVRWWDDNEDEPRWRSRVLTQDTAGGPAACSWGGGRVDLAWRVTGREEVGHRTRTDDDTWAAATTVPTPGISGLPTICTWGPGRLDLFWRGPRSELGHAWWTTGARHWAIESVPGVAPGSLASDPVATCWGPERVDVAWVTSDGELTHLWYDRRWGPAGTLGMPGSDRLFGTPAIWAWAPDQLDVVARLADGRLAHNWWNGRTWHGWVVRGATFSGAVSAASWRDGRVDVFGTAADGRLAHAGYEGRPVNTAPVRTIWAFLRETSGRQRIDRLRQSFACGELSSGCSGAMISPHVFLTASHCNGPGWTGSVRFFHQDHFALSPDGTSQQLSPRYEARTFPWQHSGIGGGGKRHGDTNLWWVADGVDGVPPGIRYGYVELSPRRPPVGSDMYSFWRNPADRFDTTLLYSAGSITSLGDDSGSPDGWLGPHANVRTWTHGGASGSSNFSVDEGGRVFGVTQGGGDDTSVRVVPLASRFVSDHDSTDNDVVDAVDYDWLFSRPVLPLRHYEFTTPFELSRWVADPDGSPDPAVVSTQRTGALLAPPRLIGGGGDTDGFWALFARFTPGSVLRLSVVAKGTAKAGTAPGWAYVGFRSDSTGDRRNVTFTPGREFGRFLGTVTLGTPGDYRLVLGTAKDTSWELDSMSVVDEAETLSLATHDERRTWEWSGESRPMAWSVDGGVGFCGVAVGRSSTWAARNRHLALLPSTRYRIRCRTRTIQGKQATGVCWVRCEDLAGTVVGETRFDLRPGAASARRELVVDTGSGAATTLTFGCETDGAYAFGAIEIRPA